jgi:UDP-glucose 4-epimerase
VSGTVLVTGGAGFIGSRVAKSLIADGHDVMVVDDLSTGERSNVPAGASFVELDLSKDDGVARLPDAPWAGILHLAGQSSGKRSFDDPLRDFDANARSTLLLAQWANEHDVPLLVHASSMGVYGMGAREPISEEMPAEPISYYGASKLAAEQALALAAKTGLRTCSLRMFNVYGAGQDLENLDQGMVSIYLAYVLRGETVVVRGSLDRVRDLVHVDDVVEAWKLALARPVTGALNVGSGTGTRVDELLKQIFRACGVEDDYPVVEHSGTPGDAHTTVADIDRARRLLGWTPQVALEDGLREFVAGATAGAAT